MTAPKLRRLEDAVRNLLVSREDERSRAQLAALSDDELLAKARRATLRLARAFLKASPDEERWDDPLRVRAEQRLRTILRDSPRWLNDLEERERRTLQGHLVRSECVARARERT